MSFYQAYSNNMMKGVYNRTHKRYHFPFLVYVLTVVPFLDIVFAQIQGLQNPTLDQLSLAQLYHGVLLIIILYSSLAKVRKYPPTFMFVAIYASFFALCVLASQCVLLVSQEAYVMENLVASFQVFYWLAIWFALFSVCTNNECCTLIMSGLLIAGIYASLSVLFFCALYGDEYSNYVEIVSSTGGLVTAKGLGGILATATMLALWRWRTKGRIKCVIVFLVCILGLLFTYQRTGLVAVCSAILWLVLWCLVWGKRRGNSRLAILPVVLLVCAVSIQAVFGGLAGLQDRWRDVHDISEDKAGSGRIGLWRTATQEYRTWSWERKLIGAGYSGMRDAIGKHGMKRRHTHTDWLDILLTYGFLGILGWILLNAAVLKMLFSCPKECTEFAIGVAVYLIMFVECFLTGQVFGPHVMSFYLLTMSSLCLHRFYSYRNNVIQLTK